MKATIDVAMGSICIFPCEPIRYARPFIQNYHKPITEVYFTKKTLPKARKKRSKVLQVTVEIYIQKEKKGTTPRAMQKNFFSKNQIFLGRVLGSYIS